MHYYLLKSILYSDTLRFYLKSFTWSRFHPGPHITFRCHASLGSSWLWQFLRLSVFFMILTILRCAGQAFGRISICQNLSDLFLMMRFLLLACFVLFWQEKDHQGQMPFPSQHVQGTYDHDHCWRWPWPPHWASAVEFLHVHLLFHTL